VRRIIVTALVLAACGAARESGAQPSADLSKTKWEIVDNSFLVEESFNQEAGVFQNIFTWTRSRDGAWAASFTQEWPAPSLSHQFSYTIPFSSGITGAVLNDVFLNYRYQLFTETDARPAVSPRLSVIVPTGSEGLRDGTVGMQVNIPVSKQFGDLYLHANGGFTWLPDMERTPHVAAGAIVRLTSMFHLVMETAIAFGESATVSPGFRRGWNIGDHQLVIGAAAPLTAADGRSTFALLTYFSYELPFR